MVRASGGAGSGPQQVAVPVWQTGPFGCARTRSASPSQSARTSTACRTFPLVSPFFQSFSRDRLWKWTSPVRSVSSIASRSIHASMSTLPVPASCTMAGTRPRSSNFTPETVTRTRARAAGHRVGGPPEDVEARRRPSAVDHHLPAVAGPLRVDREHRGLRAVAPRDLADDRGIADRGAVHRDLVRAGPQDLAGEIGRTDATADGERDEQDVGDACGEVDDGAP